MSDDFQRLTEVLSGWSRIAAEHILPEMEIDAGLDIDSLSRLELVLALNKDFRHIFDENQVFAATTVADLMRLLPA